jgi:PAS domain S-box-containing protein
MTSNTAQPHDAILYIDDEQANLDSFMAMYWSEYQVYTAINTRQALQIMAKNPIKLVITDQRMPDESGLSFIKKVKHKFPNIVFIIATGYADLDMVVDAINSGVVYRVILKPWQNTEMKQAIINGIATHNLLVYNQSLITNLKKSKAELESTIEVLKTTSKSLADNENKYKLLFENVQNGFALFNYNKNREYPNRIQLVEMNPGFRRLLLSLSRAKSTSYLYEVINEIGQSWDSYIKQVMETGKSARFEYCINTIDWYIDVQIFKHSKVQFAAVVDDINERKKAEDKLNLSEKRLNAIFENAPMLMMLLDNENNIVKINQTGIDDDHPIMQYQCGSVLGCALLPAPNNHCGHGPHCAKCKVFEMLSYTQLTGNPVFKNEIQIVTRKSSGNYIKTYLLSTSRIIENNQRFILATFDDITDRKKLEFDLKAARSVAENNEQQSRLLANITFEGILIHKDGIIADVNESLLNLTGFSKTQLIGGSLFELLFDKEYEQMLELKMLEEHTQPYQILLNRNNQPPLMVEIEGRSFLQQGKRYRVVSLRDLTERLQTENLVKNIIIETEEKERARFAQEIHDGLGPILSNVQMYFDWLADESENRQFVYEKGAKSLKMAFQTLREISNNLSPHILQNFGLAKAMANFIDQLPTRESINIQFDHNIDAIRFDLMLETGAYRILTELINNGLKYAKATSITISITLNSYLLALKYSDNGAGFDPVEAIQKGKSHGLINIKNRAQLLNGIINFESVPNCGTTVYINFHIPKL